MGTFSEYIGKKLNFEQIADERKKQLRRIAAIRGGRAIIAYSADLSKGPEGAPISIDYSDLVTFGDQLSNCTGKAIDVILETPGGEGTVAEDIVRMIRDRFDDVAFIIPGYAKSAGTIMAMSGDDILMGPTSALGPIDAQLLWQGKVFSAEALLEGMEKIKNEVNQTGVLNKAYIPILQNISPGEIQSARNALDFARNLVTKWLATYKFRTWTQHSNGDPVTPEQRDQRAAEIASELCSHQKWLSHSRSIRLDDLQQMKLKVTDFTKADPSLGDAIQRYHALVRMAFQAQVCKIIETVDSQIYKNVTKQQVVLQPLPAGSQPGVPVAPADATNVVVDVTCGSCGQIKKLQANFIPNTPLVAGAELLQKAGAVVCKGCGSALLDAGMIRKQIEAQTGKAILS